MLLGFSINLGDFPKTVMLGVKIALSKCRAKREPLKSMIEMYSNLGILAGGPLYTQIDDRLESFLMVFSSLKQFCSILTGITSFFSSVFSWFGKMISLLY